MNGQCPHYNFEDMASHPAFPLRTFTAYSLLRNYNYIMSPQNSGGFTAHNFHKECHLPEDHHLHSSASESILADSSSKGHLPCSSRNLLSVDDIYSRSAALTCNNFVTHPGYRRPRGEKKPIPEEQKDEKYFEKRRRNNEAAKKSRDARKLREDQVALRVTILEHENALLKAQVITLREEASSLRQLLLHKKALEIASNNASAP